jgi:glutamate racemase
MTASSLDKSSSSLTNRVGVFDSGFGGLTVLGAIRRVLPQEDIVYFGDTARLPYGNKSKETILRYALECASFLVRQHIKLLVVACNTACAHALDALEAFVNVPVVGIIPAAVDEVVQTVRSARIGILGTRATVASGVYQKALTRRLPEALLFPVACPLFVPLAEEGYAHHPLAALAAQEYLGPLREARVEAVLLACTHYPLLRDAIERAMGPGVRVIDPAMRCAEAVRQRLEQDGLLNPQTAPARLQFFVSDDPERFRSLGSTFLDDLRVAKDVNLFERPG